MPEKMDILKLLNYSDSGKGSKEVKFEDNSLRKELVNLETKSRFRSALHLFRKTHCVPNHMSRLGSGNVKDNCLLCALWFCQGISRLCLACKRSRIIRLRWKLDADRVNGFEKLSCSCLVANRQQSVKNSNALEDDHLSINFSRGHSSSIRSENRKIWWLNQLCVDFTTGSFHRLYITHWTESLQ